ncbi:hypothetical protein LCGC14_1009440 [marine sediment metagenome]|uniref:Uncharacterized protein n=1 Tax=marine sediment metagenome TaxID=412755 RepID=A0A0F9N0T0_9ZZZZ|nr:hypothetical protein [Candidatus Aminicenantes bacterium]
MEIVERKIYRGKLRTLVRIQVKRACGHMRPVVLNLDNVPSYKPDPKELCPDCLQKILTGNMKKMFGGNNIVL